MPTNNDSIRSEVSEIDSAISKIKQGDGLAKSGEQSLAAGKYREAITQLKGVRQKDEEQVHEIAGKLLKCAYQHGQRLINDEPVANIQDIEKVLEEAKKLQYKKGEKRELPQRSVYRDVRERIAKGNRLQKDGEYDAAIERYKKAKRIVDQQLTKYSGKSLNTEIDLQLRKTRNKKQPEVSEKLNRIYGDIRKQIADADRLREKNRYNEAVKSYQKANEIIDQHLVGSSGKNLKTEINISLKKARKKKQQAVQWVKKLDEAIQQLNHERLTRHGFHLQYHRAAVDPEAVSEPPTVVYTPPLNPEVIDRITAYYHELQSFERQLGSVGETDHSDTITRLLGDILESRHSDIHIDPEGEQDVVSSVQDVVEGYIILVENNDNGGIIDLEDRLKKIQSDIEGEENRVDAKDLTRRLTDIRSWIGERAKAIQHIEKVDNEAQKLNHDLLSRHGFDIPSHRVATESREVNEPGTMVFTPPIDVNTVNSVVSYYSKLQSFEQQLESVTTEIDRPTTVTKLIGTILETRYPDAKTDLKGEQDVVDAGQNVLEGYMLLIQRGDNGGITELEKRLEKIRSDTDTKEHRVDADEIARRLTDIRLWIDERAEAIQQIQKVDNKIQQLNHELLSRHGFDLPFHRAAAESQAVNEPDTMVFTPPIEINTINSVISYYCKLQSFEQQLRSVTTETDRPTTVTKLIGAILETRHLDAQINLEGEQDVVDAAQNVLEGYILLVQRDDDDSITELEDRLKKIRSNPKGKQNRVDAKDLSSRLTNLRSWIDERAKRVDLQSRADDLRNRWLENGGEHLNLDIDLIEQLTGSNSLEPSLSQFESGLETAERIVALATDVKAVREEYETPVVDRLPEAFGQYLDARGSSGACLDRLEKTLNVVETALDAHRQYQSYPFDRIVEYICVEMEENRFDMNTEELIRLIEEASDVIDFLSLVDTDHPSVQPDEWRECIHSGLENVSPDIIRPLASLTDRMGETLWERRHLYQYEWDDFEDLVASVFASKGYETRPTQGTRDGGVDIWARHQGDRVAIEVKQSRNSPIGRPPLQKLSSHIPKGDADRVIIVTSSNFGQTAQDYGDEFGQKMRLVDGEELVQMLTESDHPPPLVE